MKNSVIIAAISSAKDAGDFATANVLFSVLLHRWDANEGDDTPIKLFYETAADENPYYELLAVQVGEAEAFLPVPLASSMIIGKMLHRIFLKQTNLVEIRERHDDHRGKWTNLPHNAVNLLDGLSIEERNSARWTLASPEPRIEEVMEEETPLPTGKRFQALDLPSLDYFALNS